MPRAKPRPVPQDAAAVVAEYEPQGPWAAAWPQTADAVRGWVLAARPAGRADAAKLLTPVARLAAWAVEQDMPLDPETVLHPDTVERFCAAGLAGVSQNAVADYRSRLRRVGTAATRRAPWPSKTPMPRRSHRSPYTGADVTVLLAAGERIVDDPERERAFGMVPFGLAVGPQPGELLRLRAADIATGTDGLVEVLLGEGTAKERIVVAAEPHGPALLAVAAARPSGPLLTDGTSKDAVTLMASNARPDGRCPVVSAARLRTTWLVGVLGRAPLPEVLRAAGLETAWALTGLVPYTAGLGPAKARAALAGRG